jgi:uncharacterized protein YhjY with autotransporter beta-barrel domain
MPRVRVPSIGVKRSSAWIMQRRKMSRLLHGALGALAVALPGALAAQTSELRLIDQLFTSPSPGRGTIAAGLSGNGLVAVGSGWPEGFGPPVVGTTPERQAFRWTAAGGTVGLGFLPGSTIRSSFATGASWDGSVVVGAGAFLASYAPEIHQEAFRWTAAGGMQRLGLGGYTDSVANGVSADGSVVVGSLSASGVGGAVTRFPVQAFRWTPAGGLERLGFLPGAQTSAAAAVSGDGTVIVGNSGREAFRWTAADGLRGLGLPDDPVWPSAAARAVSYDGTVIAGDWSAFPVTQAFVWTAGSGMLPLGFLPAVAPPEWQASPGLVHPYSSVRAVSADGAIVVGTSGVLQARASPLPQVQTREAFRWSAASGMQSVPALLRAAGIDLGGRALEVATGITSTGPQGTNIILGYTGDTGSTAFSWIARLPDPRDGTGEAGFTTPEALLASLGQIPSAAATAERLVWAAQREALLLAEHYGATLSAEHPVAGFVQARGGGWDPPDEWGTAFGGAAGVIVRIGAAARLGFVVSATGQDSQGGSPRIRTSVDGAGARVFALFGDTAAGPRLAAAFGYDQLRADTRRRYAVSASAEATGSGDTDGQALAGSLRGAWAIPVGTATSLSPFVSMHAVATRFGAYEEGPGSGPFPARYDTQRQTSTVAGLGAEVEHRFAGGSRAWASLGYNWRLTGDSSALSGSFVDLFAFDLRGLPVGERRWVEGAVGGALALSPRSQVVGVLGATLPTDGGGRYSVFSSLGLVIGF